MKPVGPGPGPEDGGGGEDGGDGADGEGPEAEPEGSSGQGLPGRCPEVRGNYGGDVAARWTRWGVCVSIRNQGDIQILHTLGIYCFIM